MYLESLDKTQCMGCEACVQACAKRAISMREDKEGFRYPEVDEQKCVHCGKCKQVCPYANVNPFCGEKYVFGGYNKDEEVRFRSTSGGAFSAIVEAFCDKNYVVFGAEAQGLRVFHSFAEDKKDFTKFCKSKYSQSEMGTAYVDARSFLNAGKKVLFSGTPCQVAGLKNFLGKIPQENLLLVEVVCEGVPSPLYVRKQAEYLRKKFHSDIRSFDYRYTGRGLFSKGMWDFEKERVILENGKELVRNRWGNPYWSIWLQHLMSRPSCYHCQFTTVNRVADITLGDLWGVHIYCQDLYGDNLGASLVIANTEKGRDCVEHAKQYMFGRELKFSDAIKFQGPLRKHIDLNPNRNAFMADLQGDMDYDMINRKWATKPSIKLLWQKYVWGNRQKVFFWNIAKKILGRMNDVLH